jgi:hypothetical protein
LVQCAWLRDGFADRLATREPVALSQGTRVPSESARIEMEIYKVCLLRGHRIEWGWELHAARPPNQGDVVEITRTNADSPLDVDDRYPRIIDATVSTVNYLADDRIEFIAARPPVELG